jgi:hypothetical protein
LRKNSLICQIDGSFFQGGVSKTFVSSSSGSLVLLPNDAAPGDNSRGWEVMVFHTPAGETPTAIRRWKYNDLHDGVVPAAVIFNGMLHVFCWGGDQRLHQVVVSDITASTDHVVDSTVGTGGTTRWTGGKQISATAFMGAIHVFYFDDAKGQLRHASSTNGTSWSVEILDGAGGPGGRITGIVGGFNAVAPKWDESALDLFYYGSRDQAFGPGPDGFGAETNDLRHAHFDGVSWTFETLDGNSTTDGRVEANVGETLSAIVSAEGFPNVFYRDADSTNLRHARLTTSGWKFAVLDGAGGATGRIRADVGAFSTVTLGPGPAGDTVMYVFYFDNTNGNVRVAFGKDEDWTFARLDGGGGPNGRTRAKVGAALPAAASVEDRVELFYWDSDQFLLRHAWRDTHNPDWFFEVLDGDGYTPDGRVESSVGTDCSTVSPHDPNGPFPFSRTEAVHVLYEDAARNQIRLAKRG